MVQWFGRFSPRTRCKFQRGTSSLLVEQPEFLLVSFSFSVRLSKLGEGSLRQADCILEGLKFQSVAQQLLINCLVGNRFGKVRCRDLERRSDTRGLLRVCRRFSSISLFRGGQQHHRLRKLSLLRTCLRCLMSLR